MNSLQVHSPDESDQQRDGVIHVDLITGVSEAQSILHRLFAEHVEQTFRENPELARVDVQDYLTDLLVRFARSETLYNIRDLSGRTLDEVGHMIAEGGARIGDAKHETFRHIGDLTLYLSGFYPEALPNLVLEGPENQMVDYCAQGKRSYRIASEIETVYGDQRSAVLQKLSEQFELCARGLRAVRRSFAGDSESSLLLCF